MPTHQATRYGEFFTLFGGIIALSGFFILKIEKTGINVSGSWGTPFNGLGFWGTVSGFIVAAIRMFLNIKK